MDTSSGYADGSGDDSGSFSNFATKDHASRAVDDPGDAHMTSTILLAAPSMIGELSGN